MKKIFYFILATFSLVIASCSDDEKVPADADDNFITALALTIDGTTYNASIEGNDIVMSVPYIVNLNGATASMTYTNSAKILPNPSTVTDWDNDMVFRVTSYNGDVNEYTYKVVKTEIESEGDVILKNQTEINAFADTKITMIKGNLVIGDDGENAVAITDLTPLSGIKEVSGVLQILDNYKGEALDGLNVTKIGGIQFGTKDAESKCSDTYRFRIESLQEISGDLQINNSAIQFIEFGNLTDIAGNVYIKGDAASTLSLPKLVYVGGDFDLNDNEKMPLDILELASLEKVDGHFSMIRSDNLKAIKLPKLAYSGDIDFTELGFGLESIEIPLIAEVNGNLSLCSRVIVLGLSVFSVNDKLSHLDDMNNLKSINGQLRIDGFRIAENFPELKSLVSIGGLKLAHMYGYNSRQTVCDLSNANFLTINGENPSIDIDAFCGLKQIKTKDDLSSVDVTLYGMGVSGGSFVPDLSFSKVGSLKIKGLNLDGVTETTSPQFPIEYVKRELDLVVSAKSKSLDLSKLSEVGGYIYINFNSGNILDMSNLTTVGGDFLLPMSGKKLILDKLTSVCMSENPSHCSNSLAEVSSFYISTLPKDINLPCLKNVGGLGARFMAFTSLSCPNLETVKGELYLNNSAKSTTLEFPKIQYIKKVTINKLSKIEDFSTFAPVINNGSVTEGNWTVTGCKYNPTYQDMKEGRYTPAE